MAIQLDTPRSTRPPVFGARGLGQRAIGMVIDQEQRARTNADGEAVMNSRGKPAQEQVLTVLVLEGNTGTASGGDLNPDYEPEVGSVGRMIFKGLGFGKLIDARKTIEGNAQVGDVVVATATAATIWKGKGDIMQQGVTDEGVLAKARDKRLSIGMEIEVTYRRATPAEAALVAKAEQLHMELKAIPLDAKPELGDDAF